MVLTRRLFKVEDDGSAHKGGLAVGRFVEIDPEPGAGRGGQSRLFFELAAGRFNQVFTRFHMAGRLIETALALDLFFHQQETTLPVHQRRHRQSGRHSLFHRRAIHHDDSLSVV